MMVANILERKIPVSMHRSSQACHMHLSYNWIAAISMDGNANRCIHLGPGMATVSYSVTGTVRVILGQEGIA
jgi:uncharacterized RmlC-like cupin family protein